MALNLHCSYFQLSQRLSEFRVGLLVLLDCLEADSNAAGDIVG
jgi:hypothetical protein